MADDSEHPSTDMPAGLKSFEARLASLAPTTARLDRDRVMYLAGAAAAANLSDTAAQPQPSTCAFRGRSSWLPRRFWPVATAAMALASLGLATRLAWLDRLYSPSTLTSSASSPARSPWNAENTLNDFENRGGRQTLSRDERSGMSAADGDRANYVVLRDQVLRCGVDSLDRSPAPTSGSDSPAVDIRNRVLLNQLLGG
jgi:hypothetical protein